LPYKDKAKKAANNKNWLQANREKARASVRKYHAKRRVADPDYERNKALKSKYRITAAEFDQMLAAQHGLCALCGTDTPKGVGNFHVDHCHDTDAVRALLCMDCNTGIGKLQHSPELLNKAAEYIRYHRELH
jgi:hypothetical protein